MANKNDIKKQHTNYRKAEKAKAGKRKGSTQTPPEETFQERKAHWVTAQVMEGVMTLDEALRQVKPNSVTQERIFKFLEFKVERADTNPIVKMRIRRYL